MNHYIHFKNYTHFHLLHILHQTALSNPNSFLFKTSPLDTDIQINYVDSRMLFFPERTFSPSADKSLSKASCLR